MEIANRYYIRDNYDTIVGQNKISRQAHLFNSENIIFDCNAIVQRDAVIRGDIANVYFGRHCVIRQNAVIEPTLSNPFGTGYFYYPMEIGDHVYIGERAVVSAQGIGSYVYIGKNAFVNRGCVLNNCCIIEDGAILPPNTTVASYMRFTAEGTIEGGRGSSNFVPAAMVQQMIDYTKSFYEHFMRLPQAG